LATRVAAPLVDLDPCPHDCSGRRKTGVDFAFGSCKLNGSTAASGFFMKHGCVFFTVMLLGALSLARGAELEGFLDVPWGATADEAKKQIPSRSHARPDRQKSDATHLKFDGGKFAGFKVNSFDLSFSNDHFFRAEVRLESGAKEHEKQFAALKKLLTEKYGAPGRDEHDRLECTWYFPVPGKPANLINLFADPKAPGLLIFYMSESSKAAPAGGAAPTPKAAKTSTRAQDDL
jgi:hypothetical protein